MPIRALIRDPDRAAWLSFREPRAVLQAAEPGEAAAVIAAAEARARRDGLHAVGFVSYEAAGGLEPKLVTHAPGLLPPAWFALFPAPEPCAAPPPRDPPDLRWRPSLSAADYRRRLARIRELIAAGDTYQVNFSYRLRASIDGDGAAEDLFAAMVGRQPASLGALLETEAWAICSASPELFFSRRGRRLVSRPMKGTAARGASQTEDACQAASLRASLKNRAENLMITDMVRNDLGRLADIGSVRTEHLFSLEAYPTLWQMTSSVSASTDAGLAEIFRALFPAASITGAPRRRTMQIIRELETGPREIYTGAIGVIRPDGDACFNVAIRTALVNKLLHRAEYGVGGGIVWDSDATEEYRETLTKSRILHSARTGPADCEASAITASRPSADDR